MASSQPGAPRSIAVIGSGFSGLAAAHRLHELAPASQITVFEARDRVGGVVCTEEESGYLIEHGADMFTTREPWALALCRRIQFDRELINTNTHNARAFVVHRGRLYPVPEGFTLMTPGRFWPIAKTGLLSLPAKLRMAAEYFVPRRSDASDESLAEFATRRLGREAYERLVQPLIGGIYTADPTKLSMKAALPQFVQMEQQHGGLIRGIRHVRRNTGQPAESGSGARYGLFVAPRRGMGSFLDALVQHLPAGTVRLQSKISALRPAPAGVWQVEGPGTAEPFDAIVLAVPAHHAADLLQELSAELVSELRAIPYATAAVVALGFRRDQIRHPLDTFGIVVPRTEHRRILAASVSSNKFRGRAPEGEVLLRVFIGGACQPELAELPDQELLQLAIQELDEMLAISGSPRLSRVIRWQRAMPQYHVGHLERVERIEKLASAFPNLVLAGNAFRGVGIPACIHSGEQAAERLVVKSA